ncbi:expression site-associated gene (ESAG) protein,putative [Trypanosoma brucei gambiense DAL972]|uniref:adenylate cyclase n=1 Tax=Trypanosoma brucei gambiense (strain MHOM/CI/86/DAL972) TaxID=679716 RepID=D0AAV3_TRYB9|nr:expression site-associated gene (ESAG) protein,putative [Trypanosoma brucei gambiense DAL972]CBH18804.1 expression site-associated gene (ESAG) protein,putative [Trypanosoma brucei gambiense DAL972]|eukprot:XP_011781068.1 expression site-associated gene (ESAG) protein,putative [Trypanosoma brucei gambiense DAL972]
MNMLRFDDRNASPAPSGGKHSLPTGGAVCRVAMDTLLVILRAPVALLLLLIVLPQLSVGAEANATVKVLSAAWNSYMPQEYVTAINAGFSASLESRQWTVAGSVKVEVVYPERYETLPEDFIKEQLELETDQNKIVIVYGPLGDKSVIYSIPYLVNHSVVALGLMTGSGEVRRWNPYLYFLRADPAAETLALIRYALCQLRVLRLGFMYLQGVHYGDEEYALTVNVMSQMGYELHGVFTVMSPDGEPAPDGEFKEVFERFAAALPQAIIVFGAPEKDTAKFLMMMVAEERVARSYILGPSSVQVSLAEMWRLALEAAGASFAPGQLLFTGTNPLAKDSQYIAIKRFQGVMSEYLKTHVSETNITEADYFLTHDPEGELMVYGWIAGEVLSQALSSVEWLKDRATFVRSLYNQRRYVINDIVIGDYGGTCEGDAAKHGATCECNQGSKAVYVKEVLEDGRTTSVRSGFTVLKASQCYAESSELHGPLNGLAVFMEDDDTASKAAALWHKGASHLVGKGDLGHSDRFFLHAFNTTIAEAANDLRREQGERIVTAVFGPVTGAMLDTPNITFIDPLELKPRLNKFRRHVIHLSPTLEQQLYVLSSYLAADGVGTVDAVICSKEVDGIADFLRRSLTEFGVSLRSAVIREDGEGVGKYLPISGIVFVIGLSVPDVREIARKLEERNDLRVIVLFAEFSLLYDLFTSTLNNTAGAARLVFATSLPHWGDTETSSKTTQLFHDVEKDSRLWTPLSLLAFATGRLMRAILLRVEEMSPETLVNFFYADSSIISDDMRYGVFDDTKCDGAENISEGDCASNYGATQISVWSMARALNASILPLTNPMTPSMSFRDPSEGKLSGAPLVGVIIGATFALFLVVALGVVPYFVLRNTRDNNSAPKEPTDPVTIIFTDIESSTAQWAAHPDVMADAVAAHHKLIRALISQYECYEVKTVGDSFMIASRSAFMAVQLVRDLQRAFLRHNWGASVFDEYYCRLEQDRALESEGYVPPTARLDPDVYRKLWNGLRVRVGVHTGLCDIRHDEVTKGYDYYGHTSNMSARTESAANGGQILLTRATYLSLSTAEREQLDVTALGAVPLRGVPDPVEMYQVDAVVGRSFAALRLDREVDLAADSGVTNLSTSDCASLCELGQSAQTIVAVMRALFGTFTASQREKLLVPFCERWRVTLPPKTKSVWDDNYCQEVVRRIAAKVGHVVDFTAYNIAEPPLTTSSSSSVIFISDAAVGLCAVGERNVSTPKEEN